MDLFPMSCQPSDGEQVFDRLPRDVLALIDSKLHFKDSLAFLSCCAATRAFYKSQRQQQPALGGIGLWPELCFRVYETASPTRLATWLVLNKSQLHTLYLSFFIPRSQSAVFPGQQAAALQAPVVPPSKLFNTLLGLLAGSSLRSLVFGGIAEVYIGGWLQTLPHLQHLHAIGGQLKLGPGLSQLQSLTSLVLVGGVGGFELLSLPPDLLPPRLRALELLYFDAVTLAALHMPAGGLPHLESLVLLECKAGVFQLNWLSACPGLTELRLKRCHLYEVPQELAALTGLQKLSLQHACLEGDGDCLGPVADLPQLSSLDLSYNLLTSIPAAVLSLPALRNLDILHNPLERLPFNSETLETLALDDTLLFDSVDFLTGLTALQSIYLEETSAELGYEISVLDFDEVWRLLERLAAIPSFHTLTVPWQHQDPEPFNLVHQQMEALGFRSFLIVT